MSENNTIKKIKNVPNLLEQEELHAKKENIKKTLTNLQTYLENLNKYLICKYNSKNATAKTTNNDINSNHDIHSV